MNAHVTFTSSSAEETRQIGATLATLLKAGDLVILAGDLGAGKTTLVQGLGGALDVRGRVTSPTYIVSRVHTSLGMGPDLIHVDAYRIEDALDLETIDLDTELEHSITVVEWGAGKVEALAEQRFEVYLAETGEGEGRNIAVHATGSETAGRLLAAFADAVEE